MNIYIAYRHQSGLAKTAGEAKTIIEDFFCDELDEYLVCNENILRWIDILINGKYNKTVRCWTTNAGYNKKVIMRPTMHESVGPVAQEVIEENRIRVANEITENLEERKEFLTLLNEPRTGKYHVQMRYTYECEDGRIEGDGIEEIVNAYSGHNAYMKVVDMAAELCIVKGRKFRKPKSLFSKSTKIEYIGE